MTRHASNWALALAIIVLIATMQWLDGITAMQERVDSMQATADALHAEERAQRLERASVRICTEALGQSVPTWTPNGELVCTPKRGKPQRQGITLAQVQL